MLEIIKRIKTVCSLTSGSKCFIVFPGTGFDEEAALIGAGREFALMKSASGKVSGWFSKIFTKNES